MKYTRTLCGLTLAALLLTTICAPGAAGEMITFAEAGPASDNEPVIKEGAEVSLHGNLKGKQAGIGGEHTGWTLEYQTKAGPRQIQVDCSALDAEKIPEGAVTIAGTVVKKDYPERGPTLILKATKVERNRGVPKKQTPLDGKESGR